MLELIVIVVAAALLGGAVFDQVLPVVDRSEHLAFMRMQRQLQNALTLEAATLIAEGHPERLGELGALNPMGLFRAPPPSYLGSLPWPNPAGLPGGVWYYDEHSSSLAYRVGKHTRFDGLGGPSNRVEFRVVFVFDDRDGDGTFDAARDQFDGLRFEPRHAYRWPD